MLVELSGAPPFPVAYIAFSICAWYLGYAVNLQSILFGALEVRYLMAVWNAHQRREPDELDLMG